MIRSIGFKFGRASGLLPVTVETTPITVFVGPNNSGKSKVLSELNHYCTGGQKDATDVILEKIEFDGFSPADAEEKIKQITLRPRPGENIAEGNVVVGKKGARQNVSRQRLLEIMQVPNDQSPRFCQWYLGFNTLMLDGPNRINLINLQPAGDLSESPQTSFQVLFRDDVKRKEVRRIVHEAFGAFLVVDPTNLGQFRLRLSDNPPSSDIQERGLHEEAVLFHGAAKLIDETSDGVKAYTGIITEIVAGDPSVLLIDEPEAFLHPSLAFNLGKEISIASRGSEKRLFVSTHSSEFVMGCIQSGAPLNIVRLTYRESIATARVLPNEDILRLMRNPLLRSTGVLKGLFYDFVVVTESDADRAFYQEINERLLSFRPELGIPNCLFLNAQNKQTVQTIIQPLRELGIPTAGIVDIDVLKEGGGVWGSFLASGFIPKLEGDSLAILRTSLNQKFAETGKDMKRMGGINLLHDADQEAAKNLLARLAEYGLFVVRHGELESWLQGLGASGHGPNWLIRIFEKMGEDPDSSTYVKPGDDDVWAFTGEIKAWLTDPSRKGIPS